MYNMESTNKNIIRLIFECMLRKDCNSFRQCSKYLNLIIGKLYFNKVSLKASYVLADKHKFSKFIHKYDTSVRIWKIYNSKQLAYFRTYNIEEISLEPDFKYEYFEHLLAPYLKKLSLQNDMNNTHRQIILPTTLQTLCLMSKFNKRIHVLNPLKETLDTDCLIIPPTLQKLFLWSDDYNNKISELPPALTFLSLSSDCYKLLPNLLPLGLKELLLRSNKEIDKHILPETLEYLDLGYSYNKPILKDVLPASIIELRIGRNFIHRIEPDVLPISLQKLNINSNCLQIEYSLPTSLQILYLNGNSIIKENILPTSLLELHFKWSYKLPINANVLPPNIKKIVFGSYYNTAFTKNILPINLEELTFGDKFNQPFEENIIPHSVKKLRFGRCYDQDLHQNILPKSLQKLTVNSKYVRVISHHKSIKKVIKKPYDIQYHYM
jgi:hypothetical protein